MFRRGPRAADVHLQGAATTVGRQAQQDENEGHGCFASGGGFAKRLENFVGMALRCDAVPNLANGSVFADPEGHPHDAKERLAEERFHAASAVGLDDVKLSVGKQREIKVVLDLKFGLRLDGVAAAADDRGVELLEFLDGVTKLGRFVGSTGRVGFGIEIENQILPAKVG